MLSQQNADLKRDISKLNAEKKAIELQSLMESEKIKMNEFELAELQERVEEVEDDMNKYIDKGDNLYAELRQDIRDQDETEVELNDELNNHKNNMNEL